MGKKKIVMLSTGGTIASKVNPETGLLTSGLMTGEELSEQCEIPKTIEIDVQSVFQIPSNAMTFGKLQQLKNKIIDTFKNDDVDGVVVTHGTDTLEETAYFLDLTINDTRPVIVTGSQRGPTVMGTDAYVNLRQAIILAANEQARDFGTLVLFNERAFSAKYIEKVHASNVAGFTSHGFGYLGSVDQERVYIYQKPMKREYYDLKQDLPEVEIIKCSLGSGTHFIDHAIDIGLEGIILEAPGRGHVPPVIMDSIRRAVNEGVHVILTTSAEEGEVKVVYDFPGSVHDLKKAGVILGKDYSSKKARIKLAVLLAAGKSNIDDYF